MNYRAPALFALFGSFLPAFSAPIITATSSCSVVEGGTGGSGGGTVIISQTGTSSVNCQSPNGFAQGSLSSVSNFDARLSVEANGVGPFHPTLPLTYSSVSVSGTWENLLVITGGSGDGVFIPDYAIFPGPSGGCSLEVNGTLYGCGGSVPFTFGTPFAVRISMSNSIVGVSSVAGQSIVTLGSPGSVSQGGSPVSFTIAEASTPVPEPASLGLVAFGFAATAWLARRRHDRRS